MSTVLVVTPIVVAQWPVIAAAVSAAVAGMGFAAAASESESVERRDAAGEREILEVEDSEILSDAAAMGERIVVERDGVRATFSRDARGALKLCMEGRSLSKRQLRALGEELIGRVTQQFVYHRIVSELKGKNMAIVGEEITEDRVVRLRIRNS
jgi:hypothetical protein